MGTAVVVVVLAGVLALVIATSVWLRRRLLIVSVVGRSMEPTLRSGDRVLARRVSLAAVRRGDVVVVAAPAQMTAGSSEPQAGSPGLLIKRAYAVPGDPGDPGDPVTR
ncbi:S26 family signal peptidase [Micromonospora sp. NPDC003197]